MKFKFFKKFGIIAAIFCFFSATGAFSQEWQLRGDTFTHDPTVIYENGRYYMFYTAPYIGYKISKDGIDWGFPRQIFKASDYPAWWKGNCPADFNIWAPDVTKIGDTFYLYYCVSTFGSNKSIIGLLTSTDLKNWKDEGEVFRSTAKDNYNCIDPNFVQDYEGNYYLSFGSFWTGIYLIEIDKNTMKAKSGTVPVNLAGRISTEIEAPYIWTPGNGYYYLLVSFDRCCQGINSTYSIHYGRSENINGPYVDKNGKKMLKGAGITLKATQGSKIGPGGQSISKDKDGNSVLVYHYYDRDNYGRATLGIMPLELDEEGWIK